MRRSVFRHAVPFPSPLLILLLGLVALLGTTSVSYAAAPVTLSPPDGTTLPVGGTGIPYSESFSAAGGSGTYIFTANSLPPGLSLDPATGELSGIPQERWSSSLLITVTVTDANDPTNTDSGQYRMHIGGERVLPDATVGISYPGARLATGGMFTPDIGSIPPGMEITVSGARIVLEGTPQQEGTYAFAFSPVAERYTITVLPTSVTLTLNPAGGALVDGQVSKAYSQTFTASGGSGNYTYAVTAGALPAGLTLAADGTLSGTPTAAETASFTVTASDVDVPAITGSADFTLRINAAPADIIPPDPSQDPHVIGLINAQASAAPRYAQTQMTHFHRRLEQLHHEGMRRASSIDGSIGISGRVPGALAFGPDGSSSFVVGPFAVWSGGFVNSGELDRGGVDLDHTLTGISGGIDYRLSGQFVGGVGIGYGRGRTDIGQNGTESRSSAVSGAIYGSYKPVANLFIDGLVGGSWMDFDSTRFVAAIDDFATGSRDGKQLFSTLTVAYELRDEVWFISPYGRVEFSRSWLDGFHESGGDIYGLTYGDQTIDTLSGVVGIRSDYAFQMGWGTLTPGVRIEYTRDFEGSTRAILSYTELGGLPYTIDADPDAREHVALGLSLDFRFRNDWNLGLDYRSSFGGIGRQDPDFGARLGVRF